MEETLNSSHRTARPWTSLLAIGLVCATVACASSKGGVDFRQAHATGFNAAEFDYLDVNVDAAPQVYMTDYKKRSIAHKIEQELRAQGLIIRDRECGRGAQLERLDIDVLMTRYDKGSSVARFILAGLGQIHIDADVTLRDHDSGEVLATYEVTKTFAWGGLYGAVTEIDDVEVGFAKAVASGVAQQE